MVNTSVIWESRGQRSLFGPRGVSGLVNVEITPELCVRLASAYATTLKKGAVGHHLPRLLPRRAGAQAGRDQRAQRQRDQRARPGGRRRCPSPASTPPGRTARGGIALRTTPGDPQSVDIVFMDEHGADLSPAAQRKLERVFSRQEFRRAFPGEIAELSFPAEGGGGLHPRAAALRGHHRGPRRRA